ncbi:cytochrome c3 family protein [Chrysiogenes arsenatis]|uniref:cytochrome c3 family protein n=1 Tax=Chrysiogenes arsenatis TaxID=309797 RepID=UPI00042703E5|nr:cytochrome c3 family protein [Chrysiogenes arsenatis]
MNRFTFAIFLLFGCLLMGAITYSIAQTAVVTYNHDRHVNYMGGMECTTCHGTTLEILSPPRSACVQCHGNAFNETVIIPALKTHGPA